MLRHYDHRQRDVTLVMDSLSGDPQQVGVLVDFGRELRQDVVRGLREVIATGAWMGDWHVRAEATQWRSKPRFRRFLEADLEDRRDRGPKHEHLDTALLPSLEARTALRRLDGADCPQHCRADRVGLDPAVWAERRAAEYRQALFGWYAAIQRAHRILVHSAIWLAEDAAASARFGTFSEMLAAHARRQDWSVDRSADAWRELLLMMDAWSPYTCEALSEVLPDPTKMAAFRGWGSGFEPAGRDEAHAAATALPRVLTPEERTQVLAQVDWIDQRDAATDTGDVEALVDDSELCTSTTHGTYGDATAERRACARARAAVMRMGSRDDHDDRSREVERAAQLLLGSRKDRVAHLITHVRRQLASDAVDGLPAHCRTHATELARARQQSGLTDHQAADLAGISVATLQRLESGRGKTLPGKAACLGYMTALAATALESQHEAPDYVPAAISSAVASSGFLI